MRRNSTKQVAVLVTVLVVAGGLAWAGASSLLVADNDAKRVQKPGVAVARLNPVDGGQIVAVLTLAGTGASEVLVKGFARGLNADLTYISLLYDPLSVAEGPNACTASSPDIPPATIGLWQVSKDGVGSLVGRATGSLEDFGAASIRVFDERRLPSLQACGLIESR